MGPDNTLVHQAQVGNLWGLYFGDFYKIKQTRLTWKTETPPDSVYT